MDLLKQTRSRRVLLKAWKHVREQGLQSASKDTREAVRRFEADPNGLNRIARQLRERRFSFAGQRGYPAKRRGKSPRGIVVSPVPVRVVQRAILKVLLNHPAISKFLVAKGSYGGLPGRRVRDALKDVYLAIEAGQVAYAKNDIVDFFQNIPRPEALAVLLADVSNLRFCSLVEQATETELENLALLSNREVFPTHELGLAQGCCLSPLIANAYLHELDRRMNSSSVSWFRYIDDILVLARTQQGASQSMAAARSHLAERGLKLHTFGRSRKANIGLTRSGFEYLGCQLEWGQVMPSRGSRARFLQKLEAMERSFLKALQDPSKIRNRRRSVTEVLSEFDHVIKGWGNQYSFCNCEQLWTQLDGSVDQILRRVIGAYSAARGSLNDLDKRRILGVHALVDSKRCPILVSASDPRDGPTT